MTCHAKVLFASYREKSCKLFILLVVVEVLKVFQHPSSMYWGTLILFVSFVLCYEINENSDEAIEITDSEWNELRLQIIQRSKSMCKLKDSEFGDTFGGIFH